jgi:hypothetical protein
MVVFHGLIEFVSPSVFERKDVEEHGVATIDDAFGGESGLGFLFVEGESGISEGNSGGV